MVNQVPGQNCSHCNKPIPEEKPTFTESADESEEAAEVETPAAETEANPAEAGEAQTEEAPPDDAVETESGHVDNVGDEAETPVP
jgi:hypothetical protein